MRRLLAALVITLGALLVAPAALAATLNTGGSLDLTTTTAAIQGTVNPNAVATDYQFQYGTGTSYGSATTWTSAGAGTSDTQAQQTLTGLQPATTYHYRVQARDTQDFQGLVSGADATFTTPAADPSGVPMPVGDLPGWHQIFAENFANLNAPVGSWSGCSRASTTDTSFCSGLAPFPGLYSNWWSYPDGWTSCGATYEPSTVQSVSGGLMDYYFHSASVNGTWLHESAAAEPKLPVPSGNGQLHGRYSVRAKFPDALPGFHVAFLLWPDSGGQANGEIDWPDHPLSDDTTITGFVHYGTPDRQDRFAVSASLAVWHTYTIEWTASSVLLYLDSTLVGTETAHVPTVPMHWVLQTDTCGVTANNTSSGHAQVDWAVAYQPS